MLNQQDLHKPVVQTAGTRMVMGIWKYSKLKGKTFTDISTSHFATDAINDNNRWNKTVLFLFLYVFHHFTVTI